MVAFSPYGIHFFSLWGLFMGAFFLHVGLGEGPFSLYGGLFWICPPLTKITAGTHECTKLLASLPISNIICWQTDFTDNSSNLILQM